MGPELEIDLKAIKTNAKILSHKAFKEGLFFCPMLKANAYGLGAISIARALSETGVKSCGVLSVAEAEEIKTHIPHIYLFGPLASQGIKVAFKEGFIPVIGCWEDLKLWQLKGKTSGGKNFHLKFDIGMGRLGFSPLELNSLKTYLKQHPGLCLSGVASHLSEGEKQSPLTLNQMQSFEKIHRELKPLASPQYKWQAHLLNTASFFSLWHRKKLKPFFGLRTGIGLYGIKPPLKFKNPLFKNQYKNLSLKPALKLKSHVVCVKEIKKEAGVSYGSLWRAKKKSTIAVVAMGYADGFLRSFSNRCHVLFRGKKTALRGAVCMDFFMIDVTGAEKQKPVQNGEEVVVFGSQKTNFISVEEQAQKAKTLPHELLVRWGGRVKKTCQ